MAACMAGRMVDRLSLLQLRRLSSLDGLKGRRIADLTPDQFLNKVRALGDPEILGVATSSAVVCALRCSAVFLRLVHMNPRVSGGGNPHGFVLMRRQIGSGNV